MCCPASAVFLRNGFARGPSLRNPLGLLPQRQQIQQTVEGDEIKKISDNLFPTWQIQQLYIEF
jgi:hypothetical protein